MSVTYDENGLTAEQIIELVEDLGYEAAAWETKSEQEDRIPSEERTVQLRFEGITDKRVLPPSSPRSIFLIRFLGRASPS